MSYNELVALEMEHKQRKLVPFQVQYLRPDLPWFCELERKVEHFKHLLQSHSANKTKYEFEARIGTIHPETRHFVAGLPRKTGERLLSQVFPKEGNKTEKWEKLHDVLYSGGVRRRNGGPLVKKKTIFSTTFLCGNGYAIRVSLSTEEELPRTFQPGTETMERKRARWFKMDQTLQWRYDFTFNYDTSQMEIEIESADQQPLSSINAWDLFYRISCLSAAIAADPSQQSEHAWWPVRCHLHG